MNPTQWNPVVYRCKKNRHQKHDIHEILKLQNKNFIKNTKSNIKIFEKIQQEK